MKKRIPKIYEITLTKWSFRKIVAQKSVEGDNYRLCVSSGKEQYILSNPVASGITMLKFKQLELILKEHEIIKQPIVIFYIRRFGKKFINDIL